MMYVSIVCIYIYIYTDTMDYIAIYGYLATQPTGNKKKFLSLLRRMSSPGQNESWSLPRHESQFYVINLLVNYHPPSEQIAVLYRFIIFRHAVHV